MTLWRAECIEHHVSGDPDDDMVNTFWFNATSGVDATQSTAIVAALSDFYGSNTAVGAGGVGHAVDECLSGHVKNAAGRDIKTYKVDPATLLGGSPFAVTNQPLVFPVGAGLADQTAVCLSFHGDLTGIAETIPLGPTGPAGDTHPRARRRGRVFIGPIATSQMDGGTPNVGRVGGFVKEALRDAATRLIANAALSAAGVAWSIVSRTDLGVHPVLGGWIDNAFDTQRRRKMDSTAKVTF